MADNRQKWQEARRQILLALDLATEYQALGVRIAGSHKKPSAKGWIECHSVDVDQDRAPSAGINVADGPFLGRYKDFRSGRTCGLFDFAAAAGKFGGSWKEALKHYARQTAIKLPDGDEELVADRFDFFDPTFGMLAVYAAGKPGITARAIQEVGSQGARWPKNLTAEKTNHLFATPMYGSALLDLEPTGWHCCAANPKSKIRKFQGKEHEDALLKTMTAGEYGLMNVDGINRLADAEVVNIVEGLTDLYAAQSVLGPWRDETPETRKHIVLSAGGCTYHPKPEWMHHFAGKEVRIWFDVGDASDEGQTGAAVWVAAMLPVARLVRNIKLPLGKDGGKNDLRAWLVDGHSYGDMDGFAQTFEPIEAGDVAAQLSPHEALLKNLGLVVIGEHESSQRIEVFAEQTKKSATITDIDRLTIPKLIQLLGHEPVEQHVHDGREPQAGKFQIKDVRTAIASAASDKLFHSEERFGAGVWETGGQVVLVKAREVGILNPGATKIERSGIPFLNGCVLDISQSTGDWVDFTVLNRYLAEAQRPEFCWATFEEADNLFGKWYWRHLQSPRIVASLVICSWLQTLWEWRPEVFVTGSSDTGKSLLVEEAIKGMFGPLAMYVQKPTEAAIRQHLRHHAKVPMFDEFEHDNHRQKILELFRASSSGGEVIRGTSDQKGVKYRVRHIPWFAAIETGLRKQADVNRYIILELNEIPGHMRGKIKMPSAERLRDLGVRLLAIGLRHYKEARRLAATLRGNQYPSVPGRLVECFSVPWGMYSAIYGHGEEAARDLLGDMFSSWDFGGQSSRDDVDLMQEILTAEVITEGGKRSSVSRLLAEVGGDSAESLYRIGVRKVFKRGSKAGSMALWICPEVVRKSIFKTGSDFSGHSIGQYLMRLNGATKTKQRLGGNQTFWGIEIPFTTINEIFHDEHDEEHDESEHAEVGANGEARTELGF